jgi:hypothetical protein
VDVFEVAATQANPGDCNMLTKSPCLAGQVIKVSKHVPETFPVSSEFSNRNPRTNGMAFPFFDYSLIYTFCTYTSHLHTLEKDPQTVVVVVVDVEADPDETDVDETESDDTLGIEPMIITHPLALSYLALTSPV